MVIHKQLLGGGQLTGHALGLVWQHKNLLWYGLLHMLSHYGVCGVVLLCGLPSYEMMRTCYWFYFPGISCVTRDMGCLALAFLVVGVFAWVIAIVYAIMLNHIQLLEAKKRFVLVENFPDGQLLLRLLGLAMIHLTVLSGITTVAAFAGEAIAVGFFIVWYFGALLALPLLVYKRVDVLQSFKLSFVSAWRLFIEIIAALFSMLVLMLSSFIGIRVLAWLITIGICFAISVPVCMNLLVPFLLFYIPLFLAAWYAMTAVMVLPALLTLRAMR